jgi:tetratricopeptide (TPR) repeat protein
MMEWVALLALGWFAQAAPVQPADADMTRCQDTSPGRDDNMVAAACSAVLERGTLHGIDVARVQALRARAYVRLRDNRHAAADYRAAYRAGVTEPAVANGLCWSLAVLGESLDEARAACDARLRIEPDDEEALDSRGLVNLKEGRFQDAWNDYDRAFALNPRGVSWLYGRGIAALRLGRAEEGRRDIELAEIGYPGIAAMYVSYGIRP